MRLAGSMTRRAVLRLLAGLVLAGWFAPGWAVRRLSAWSRPDPLAARLRSLFADPASATAVGQAYLRAVPDEADERHLMQLIIRQMPGGRAALAGHDANAWRASLRAMQRRDFAEGRTVRVEGWVLSRTEARLCALAALR